MFHRVTFSWRGALANLYRSVKLNNLIKNELGVRICLHYRTIRRTSTTSNINNILDQNVGYQKADINNKKNGIYELPFLCFVLSVQGKQPISWT